MTSLQYDIFISYAKEDNDFAMRIYNDLNRSGLMVWRYEKDGKIGVHFLQEIKTILEQTQNFCLIDSSNARKSKFVKQECDLALKLRIENGGNISNLLILRIGKEDALKNTTELFKQQDYIRYLDFSAIDLFDQHEKYHQGIENLCQVVGATYTPWTGIPAVSDFEKEVFNHKMDLENREILLNDYNSFYKRYQQNSKNSEKRIQIIIDECEELGVKVISGYLALGRLQLNSYNYTQAQKTFFQITRIFPDDPRGWAALGIVQFHQDRLNNAMSSFNKALDLITQQDNIHHQAHQKELLYNKIRILIQLAKYSEAEELLNSLEERFKLLPEMMVVEFLMFYKKGDYAKLGSIYSKISKYYQLYHLNPIELNLVFAEVEAKVAQIAASKEDNLTAIAHLENSRKFAPFSIRYKVELALLYFCENYHKLKAELIAEGIGLFPHTAVDYYYLGQLHFLDNDEIKARQCYATSKLSWPYYSELIL